MILAAALPLVSSAAAKPKFYYGVWLPFWQAQNGASDISINLDKLQEVSPFSYEISSTAGWLTI